MPDRARRAAAVLAPGLALAAGAALTWQPAARPMSMPPATCGQQQDCWRYP